MHHIEKINRVTLGITGASGIAIAFCLLQQLLKYNKIVNLVMTTAAMVTIKQESNIVVSLNPQACKTTLQQQLNLENIDNLNIYINNDWFSSIASGSNVDDAMVVCPCTMNTLSKIANGISDDLLLRAADVILKERKNLILVPRETPLSAIHLNNMLTLAKMNVCILPPVVNFYDKPQTIDELVQIIVGRILDQLGIANTLTKRWGK
jgi:4-hydroxy-3-polyprenylbenzoate decarboxylase